MPEQVPGSQRPPRDLQSHHRQTEWRLLLGFLLILLMVGGGLIAWSYGWGGLAGGLVSIVACTLALASLAGLLWLILTWAGRWADRG